MIDADGFRPNVGIVICNEQGQVFWARRIGQQSWQFPQGGIDEGENAEQAMFRELWEEVGLTPAQVEIVYISRHWLRYRLPKRLVRREQRPTCIGQKQKWFLLRLKCAEQDVDVSKSGHPEFDGWRWVSFWYPVRQVVSFKRDVYRRVLKEFAPHVFAIAQRAKHDGGHGKDSHGKDIHGKDGHAEAAQVEQHRAAPSTAVAAAATPAMATKPPARKAKRGRRRGGRRRQQNKTNKQS